MMRRPFLIPAACLGLCAAFTLNPSPAHARKKKGGGKQEWGTLEVKAKGDFEVVVQDGWIIATGGDENSRVKILNAPDGERLAIDNAKSVSCKKGGELERLLIGTITSPTAEPNPSLVRIGYRAVTSLPKKGVKISFPKSDLDLVAAAGLKGIKAKTLRRVAGSSEKGLGIKADEVGGISDTDFGWIGMPPIFEELLGLGRTTLKKLKTKKDLEHLVIFADPARPEKTKLKSGGEAFVSDPDEWSSKGKTELEVYPGHPEAVPGPNGINPPAADTSSSVVYGKVSGGGSIVGGASASLGALRFPGNDQGFFAISGAPRGAGILRIDHPDFIPTALLIDTTLAPGQFLSPSMTRVDDSVDLTGPTTVGTFNTSVDLAPSSFQQASGSPAIGLITARAAELDPTVESELRAFPGRFLDNASNAFLPLGGLGFFATDAATNALTLTGPVSVAIDVPSGITAPPASAPLLAFDFATGQWQNAGTGTLSNGVYFGTVSQAGIIVPATNFAPATVTGSVLTPSAAPVPGALVEAIGEGWMIRVFTDAAGAYSFNAPPGLPLNLKASKGGIDSAVTAVVPGAAGSSTMAATLSLTPPVMVITLSWDDQPRDLDSHLTIPNGTSERLHVYYSNRMVPNAILDTDDTSSFGPEITTVTAFNDGTYRFSVHHFAGDDTISLSGAIVNLIVEGRGVYTQTPPAGAAKTKDSWRLWDIIVSGGAVQNVLLIDDYLPDVDASDLRPFSPYVPPAVDEEE